MKGILHKTDQGWMVKYNEKHSEKIILKGNKTSLGSYKRITSNKSFPLHPDDVKQINKDSLVFDNIEARIAAYPYVEFEIEKEYIDSTTNQVQSYAKLINNIPTPLEPNKDSSRESADHIDKNIVQALVQLAKDTNISDGDILQACNNWYTENGKYAVGDDYNIREEPAFLAGAKWMKEQIINKK